MKEAEGQGSLGTCDFHGLVILHSMKTNSSVLLFVQSEAEVGIIEKITLMNFMCHTMLEVNLGANVNFIIGRNGSESCR